MIMWIFYVIMDSFSYFLALYPENIYSIIVLKLYCIYKIDKFAKILYKEVKT